MKLELLQHPITKAFIPIISGMCRHADVLNVTEEMDKADPFDSDTLVITVLPHQADFPVICGTRGRQIKSIKHLVERAGEHFQMEARINLEESMIGSPEPRDKFQQDPEFDVALFERQLREIAVLVFSRIPEIAIERFCDKLRVVVTPPNPEDLPTIVALADLFYPWGYRKGMIVDIKPPKENRAAA